MCISLGIKDVANDPSIERQIELQNADFFKILDQLIDCDSTDLEAILEANNQFVPKRVPEVSKFSMIDFLSYFSRQFPISGIVFFLVTFADFEPSQWRHVFWSAGTVFGVQRRQICDAGQRLLLHRLRFGVVNVHQ